MSPGCQRYIRSSVDQNLAGPFLRQSHDLLGELEELSVAKVLLPYLHEIHAPEDRAPDDR